MKKKKTFILTIIGLFIFLFGVIGITYAYWQLTLTQSDENLVYTDCLKLTVDWGDKADGQNGFQLTDAYPMTNEELVSDFFPSTTPYHFTIENQCENEVPISINMESITTTDPQLKDDYVDVILWESKTTEKFNPETDKVLSHEGSTEESKYRLIDNAENKSMIADNAKKAYQLYKFKLPGKTDDGSTENIKEFNLLVFMDYATPVSTPQDVTNNANWAGKITLNNYEIPKVKIGGIDVELAESGDGLYEVDHKNDGEGLGAEWKVNPEYRYAGPDPDNYVWFNCEEGTNSGKENCEKWRIIGLVNVQTKSGITQRLKIFNSSSSIEDYWDNENDANDWTKASLMKKLNEIDGEKGEYYQKLKDTAINMISEDIIWNIGGTGDYDTKETGLAKHFYGYERGTLTGNENAYPNTWPAQEDETTIARVGLIYPSDYGYAVGGTKENRATCLDKEMYSWDTAEECNSKDWLKPESGYMWLLLPNSSFSYGAFFVHSVGFVGDVNVYNDSYGVAPVVYLTSKVTISGGTGDSESPVGSEENPFILTME